jgi:hypothetical protein
MIPATMLALRPTLKSIFSLGERKCKIGVKYVCLESEACNSCIGINRIFAWLFIYLKICDFVIL